MPSALPVVWVAIAIAVLCVGSYFVVPRGKDQTLYRTSIVLTLVCCYMMWAVTYLAQLNPLIAPRRSDLRIPGVSE